MPSSIDAPVAERLDISEERARTLLRTLVKELRDRARTEGVRLPELGTFQEEHGALRFSPSPSLRRLVNRQYEGLETEDLSSAAGYDRQEDESIPTLLDHPGDRPRSAPSSGPEPSADDEWNYPVIEEEDEEVRGEGSTVGPAPSHEAPESIHDGPESIHDMDEPEQRSSYNTESEAEPSSAPPSEADEEEQSETIRTFGGPPDTFQFVAGVLLLALLLGLGWFVLDQTNVLSSLWGPDSSQPTVAETEQATPSGAPEAVGPDTTMEASAGASSQQRPRYPGVGPSEMSDRDSEGTTAQAGGETPARSTIDPAAGGWTIVVASTASRSSASPLVNQYQARFADTTLPVGIIEARVGDDVRYRVALGQYDSRASARRALEKYASMLPDGAWPLQLG